MITIIIIMMMIMMMISICPSNHLLLNFGLCFSEPLVNSIMFLVRIIYIMFIIIIIHFSNNIIIIFQ